MHDTQRISNSKDSVCKLERGRPGVETNTSSKFFKTININIKYFQIQCPYNAKFIYLYVYFYTHLILSPLTALRNSPYSISTLKRVKAGAGTALLTFFVRTFLLIGLALQRNNKGWSVGSCQIVFDCHLFPFHYFKVTARLSERQPIKYNKQSVGRRA